MHAPIRKLLLMAVTALALTISSAPAQSGPGTGLDATVSSTTSISSQVHGETQPFIIGFSEAPVASYQGEIQNLPAPPRRGLGRGRVDMKSPQAKGYARALEVRQQGREKAMGQALGRNVQATARMQHAFNGIVAELTSAEAALIGQMEDVMLVEPYTEYELLTDVGPLLIDADKVWFNNPLAPGLVGQPANPQGAQGEGVIFGIVDSGINFNSPSFSEVDMDGFVHTNPLGDGVFLGTCAAGGIDEGRCNAKLIGGYDFVCTLTTVCETPGLLEIPGFSDENGHGSHTASTAAGNRRMAEFRGNQLEISGVAPRANIIAYDSCFTNAVGQGLCPNVSTLASINQAVADGVDVINYSIGGGTQPWQQAISLAFLAASDAGVFVSASAGNSGPGAGTLGHVQPWVSTVAAAQHGRGGFNFVLEITGPVAPPANIEQIFLTPGVNGVAFEEGFPGTTPLVVSPGIDTGNDGCAAFSAGLFEDAIAVIRRGACPFSDKVNNADAAGAVAVVIANNAPGVLSPSVPGTSIPAFLISQADADALRDFAADNPGVTAAIPLEAFISSNTPDALAAFSSRGPSSFELLKPDVTGPGVLILAADAGGPDLTGLEELVGLKSGTSMSSPHNAGAGGLLRQLHPDWSPAEIKSALMMTAEQTVLLEDQVSPAGPFAAGSGRINVERAARSGLVLHETTGNYLAANPETGGDPSLLNLSSMANSSCIGSCTFERTFRAARANQRNWDARLEGLPGSVDKPRFNLAANGIGTLSVTVNTSGFASDGVWHFGALVLTPRGKSGFPDLRLPIAVRVPPPELVLSADQASITLGADSSGEVQVEISNQGGPFLDYQVDNTGVSTRVLADQPRGAVNSGTRSGFITDLGFGLYASDDFSIASETNLSILSAEGFTQGQPIGTGASAITWSVFPDAGGQPAGNPETSPGMAVWSYTSAPNGPGVGTADNIITLDLAAAGQDVTLPPGTWWVVVHSTTTSVANNWVWFFSNSGSGNPPHTVFPVSTGPVWTPNLNFAGLAYRAEGTVECGASWIVGVTPDSGSLDFEETDVLSIQIDSAGLAAGDFTGFVCIDSNDPVQPQATIEIQLTVEP